MHGEPLHGVEMSSLSSKRAAMEIVVADLWKEFPRDGYRVGTPLFTGVSCEIRQGEFVSLFGPNGSGKTTLLRFIAGLEPFQRGQVLVGGEPAVDSTLLRSIVYQEHGLFPWKTVRGNIDFALRAKGVGRESRDRIASLHIELVQLRGHEAKYPHELSGGMRQRAAIARALCTDPSLLLLDEPFAALDAHVRRHLQSMLLRLVEDGQRTVLFVTHDPEEAILLSDRVLVLNPPPTASMREILVSLGRPRKPDIRYTPAFRSLLDQLLNSTRNEEAQDA